MPKHRSHAARSLPLAAACLALAALGACDEKPAPPAAPAPAPSNTAAPAPAPADAHDDHAHDHADGEHDHDHGHTPIPLGEATIGAFTVAASRDEGPIVPGKDAPVDAVVTPAAGSTARPAAVRFWIGAQDGRGSVKARADVEDPKEPTRYHTHVEIPSPLPEGSRLWIEIEAEGGGGEKTVGGFDLKT